MSWTGECSDGRASGTGTLRVAFDSEYLLDTAATGRIEEGKRVGPWVRRWGDGVEQGSFANGEMQGLRVTRFASGLVIECEYVDGKRHDRRVARFPDGRVQVTIFEHDEMVGHE